MRLFNLMKATENFSKENVIGSGRSGTMYRATLPNGTLLAVRRLEESHHSDSRFISEMKTLGRIKHSNLVPLVGFCIARKERLLIYKYMVNGSLYQALHQRPEGEPKFMEWPRRLMIAFGTARGLAWLHHCCSPCIILRNLNSKRILLDDGYEPKISDFGLAKFINGTESHASSSTERFCNSGLVAPESMHELVSTPKADVYSFGILMLELITGKEPIQVMEVLRNFYGNVADWIGHLSNYYSIDHESEIGRSWYSEMLKCLTIAFSCIVVAPDERPTMMEVYHLLRAIHAHDYGYTNEDEVLMSLVRIHVDLPSTESKGRFSHPLQYPIILDSPGLKQSTSTSDLPPPALKVPCPSPSEIEPSASPASVKVLTGTSGKDQNPSFASMVISKMMLDGDAKWSRKRDNATISQNGCYEARKVMPTMHDLIRRAELSEKKAKEALADKEKMSERYQILFAENDKTLNELKAREKEIAQLKLKLEGVSQDRRELRGHLKEQEEAHVVASS
ncbi:hypothetical protein ACLOJK_011663 [Asimina triloba]